MKNHQKKFQQFILQFYYVRCQKSLTHIVRNSKMALNINNNNKLIKFITISNLLLNNIDYVQNRYKYKRTKFLLRLMILFIEEKSLCHFQMNYHWFLTWNSVELLPQRIQSLKTKDIYKLRLRRSRIIYCASHLVSCLQDLFIGNKLRNIVIN